MTTNDLLRRVRTRVKAEGTNDPARTAVIIREEAGVISDIGVLDMMRKLRDMADPKPMTVAMLREQLAQWPGDAEVFLGGDIDGPLVGFDMFAKRAMGKGARVVLTPHTEYPLD